MKHLILFAGAIGSSKTPIATHLSWNLGLPIINNDAIRSEVIEDLGELDQTEFEKRRDQRFGDALSNDYSLIADVSIDRVWAKFKDSDRIRAYETFIISLDLSKEFLATLYKAKGYTESLERIDELVAHHEAWLEQFGDQADLYITDETFPDRLELCLDAVGKWMND